MLFGPVALLCIYFNLLLSLARPLFLGHSMRWLRLNMGLYGDNEAIILDVGDSGKVPQAFLKDFSLDDRVWT